MKVKKSLCFLQMAFFYQASKKVYKQINDIHQYIHVLRIS
jgi:hypothetical protein